MREFNPPELYCECLRTPRNVVEHSSQVATLELWGLPSGLLQLIQHAPLDAPPCHQNRDPAYLVLSLLNVDNASPSEISDILNEAHHSEACGLGHGNRISASLYVKL